MSHGLTAPHQPPMQYVLSMDLPCLSFQQLPPLLNGTWVIALTGELACQVHQLLPWNSTLTMIIIYSNDVKVKGPLAEHAHSL